VLLVVTTIHHPAPLVTVQALIPELSLETCSILYWIKWLDPIGV
jgi:hypothetical protein